ncbi:MAG: hypothetical protein ACYDGN_05310 [Acidimicrobiales bacterium]
MGPSAVSSESAAGAISSPEADGADPGCSLGGDTCSLATGVACSSPVTGAGDPAAALAERARPAVAASDAGSSG